MKLRNSFTKGDIENILRLANENDKSLFETLAFTGLRFSEAKKLTWSDIDFNSNIIHVNSKPKNPTKNGKSRVVHLPDRVKTTLMKVKLDSGLVFHTAKISKNADGKLNEKTAITKLKTICQKLGIKGSVHSFRNFFYTQNVMSN